MSSAYHEQWVRSLQIIKQAKLWLKHGLIKPEQFEAISESYQTPLFHPNFSIRILLFVATLIATSGISGLIMLLFSDTGESVISIVCILFGGGAFMMLEHFFIKNKHYKSGVTEGVAYIACGFIVAGVAILVNFDQMLLIQMSALIVVGFAAFRYLDLLLTLTLIGIFSWTIFYHFYEADGIFRKLIPFMFMITFSGFYFLLRIVKKRDGLSLWNANFLILEVGSLLLVYAGGNYLVVRELTINLMSLSLESGQDIPFAWLFYLFTLTIPPLYLVCGIKSKDVVLIRVGLVCLGFSVYTFRHYFFPDYTEIFLVVAGSLLIISAIVILRFLKNEKEGFTSINILSSSWADLNAEAFIISQTMGGNKPEEIVVKETGGGGSTGGGGASTSF